MRNEKNRTVREFIKQQSKHSFRESKQLPPRKPLNVDRRDREYLFALEVDKLMQAARQSGH